MFYLDGLSRSVGDISIIVLIKFEKYYKISCSCVEIARSEF